MQILVISDLLGQMEQLHALMEQCKEYSLDAVCFCGNIVSGQARWKEWTTSWQEAQKICLQKICQNHIPYDPKVFGPYPELLKPHLESPKYRLKYENGKIVGRDEN